MPEPGRGGRECARKACAGASRDRSSAAHRPIAPLLDHFGREQDQASAARCHTGHRNRRSGPGTWQRAAGSRGNNHGKPPKQREAWYLPTDDRPLAPSAPPQRDHARSPARRDDAGSRPRRRTSRTSRGCPINPLRLEGTKFRTPRLRSEPRSRLGDTSENPLNLARSGLREFIGQALPAAGSNPPSSATIRHGFPPGETRQPAAMLVRACRAKRPRVHLPGCFWERDRRDAGPPG